MEKKEKSHFLFGKNWSCNLTCNFYFIMILRYFHDIVKIKSTSAEFYEMKNHKIIESAYCIYYYYCKQIFQRILWFTNNEEYMNLFVQFVSILSWIKCILRIWNLLCFRVKIIICTEKMQFSYKCWFKFYIKSCSLIMIIVVVKIEQCTLHTLAVITDD